MSNFTGAVQQDMPRLVVQFRMEGGKETFQWGVVGSMPTLSLLGHIVDVQRRLCAGEWIAEWKDDPALVIAYVARDGEFAAFVHPGIPAYPMVGMLETIKVALVGAQVQRQASAGAWGVLGPDGRVMRG